MKSAFAYFGGKMGMASRIVAMMPAHRVYIEPYFGSGAVLFAKPPSAFEIVNDIDHAIVTFWRVLRERPDELAAACALSPHARDEFTAADVDAVDLEDVEIARRFWVRVNQSFGQTAGRNTGWSITVASNSSVAQSIMARLGRFAPAASRLSRVSVENCDAVDLVGRLAKTHDTVVYADPPYLAETRATSASNGAAYRHDAGHPDHHERLAEALNATPAKVILSGYRSSMYDALFSGWERFDLQVTAASSNALTAERRARTECLWCNFEVPTGTLALEGTA